MTLETLTSLESQKVASKLSKIKIFPSGTRVTSLNHVETLGAAPRLDMCLSWRFKRNTLILDILQWPQCSRDIKIRNASNKPFTRKFYVGSDVRPWRFCRQFSPRSWRTRVYIWLFGVWCPSKTSRIFCSPGPAVRHISYGNWNRSKGPSRKCCWRRFFVFLKSGVAFFFFSKANFLFAKSSFAKEERFAEENGRSFSKNKLRKKETEWRPMAKVNCFLAQMSVSGCKEFWSTPIYLRKWRVQESHASEITDAKEHEKVADVGRQPSWTMMFALCLASAAEGGWVRSTVAISPKSPPVPASVMRMFKGSLEVLTSDYTESCR